jgi:hypothetical protein
MKTATRLCFRVHPAYGGVLLFWGARLMPRLTGQSRLAHVVAKSLIMLRKKVVSQPARLIFMEREPLDVSRRAILSFESKFSLRLYLLLSLRAGLRKTSETFEMEDLRHIFGLEDGKFPRCLTCGALCLIVRWLKSTTLLVFGWAMSRSNVVARLLL